MTNLFLSIYLLQSGTVIINIPPTDPSHVYIMETSTNLINGWDNTDAGITFGHVGTQYFIMYPLREQEYFRFRDLGAY